MKVYHTKAGNAMNDDRINELMDNINSNPTPSKEAVNEFIEKNLSSSQAQAVQNVLKNPGLIKTLLQSPQAKQLIEQFISQRNKGE